MHGTSIFYNADGTINKESNFINAREYTIQNSKNIFLVNGLLNGHQIYYDSKTKEKTQEGKYWNGYKIGIWIEYNKDGSYTKKYYPTEKEQLMNQCPYEEELRKEKFDKNGKRLEMTGHKFIRH